MISTEILSTSRRAARVIKITKGEKQLSTPTFFPAVSRFGLNLSVMFVLNLIVSSNFPRLLVSCYDVARRGRTGRSDVFTHLKKYSARGAFLMLDSGVFESFWRDDKKWTFGEYRRFLPGVDSDFYFGFDYPVSQQMSEKRFAKLTIDNIVRSASLLNRSQFVPIIHGITPNHLASLVKQTVAKHPKLSKVLAVSERDCGSTITERARTILRMRQILDREDEHIVLHILGCGDPLSIALFSYCGADMFDSLDWTKFAFDRNELRMVDFSQLELLHCTCKVCSGRMRDPVSTTLLHNLLFYQDFVMKVQTMIKMNTLDDFLIEFLGKTITRRIRLA